MKSHYRRILSRDSDYHRIPQERVNPGIIPRSSQDYTEENSWDIRVDQGEIQGFCLYPGIFGTIVIQ